MTTQISLCFPTSEGDVCWVDQVSSSLEFKSSLFPATDQVIPYSTSNTRILNRRKKSIHLLSFNILYHPYLAIQDLNSAEVNDVDFSLFGLLSK